MNLGQVAGVNVDLGVGAGMGYAVAAAFVYGAYLYWYKRHFSKYAPLAYLTGAYLAAAAWYAPVAVVTWPAGEPLVPQSASATDLVVVGVTGLSIGAAIVVSIYAVKLGDVSYVAPLNKLPPVFVLPIEVALLDQHLGAWQVAGVALVTGAVYAANYRPGKLLAPFRRVLSYRPAQLALLGAFLFGVTDVAKRVLLQEFALAVPLVVYVTLAGAFCVVAPLGARRLAGLPREALPGVAAMGLVVATANHLVALSFALLPASVASPVINAQAIVAVVLGGVLLREPHRSRRFVAGVLAVGGVALVALG